MPHARSEAARPRRAEAPPWSRRRIGAGAAAGVLLAILFSSSVPAAASTSTATLRARAAAIAAKIAQDDADLNSLGESYLADRAELQKEGTAAKVSAAAVRRLGGLVATDRRAASVAAATAYVEAGSSTDIGVYLEQKPNQLVTSEAYLNSALSILRTAAADYSRAQANWKAAFGREQQDVAAAQAALVMADNERAAVLSTLASEQQLEKSITGEIAQLVAQQLAAKLAAQRAAAATAAAVAAAAQRDPAGPPAPSATTLGFVAPGSLASDFAALRSCESSGNYEDNTGNGYYGAYQFSLSTWDGLGESGLPSQAPPDVQDAAAYTLYRQSGWAPWPACSAILGL